MGSCKRHPYAIHALRLIAFPHQRIYAKVKHLSKTPRLVNMENRVEFIASPLARKYANLSERGDLVLNDVVYNK